MPEQFIEMPELNIIHRNYQSKQMPQFLETYRDKAYKYKNCLGFSVKNGCKDMMVWYMPELSIIYRKYQSKQIP